MTKGTPKRASKLVEDLKRIQEGDAKHPDTPLPPKVKKQVDAAVTNLDASISQAMGTRAAAHEASQTLRTTQKASREALLAGRRAVYSLFTDQDRVVEDYGLHVRKKAPPRGRKEKPDASSKKPKKHDESAGESKPTETAADSSTAKS